MRVSSLETLVREQDLGTSEYQAKGLRDVVSINRKMFREIQNSMHLTLQGLNMLQSKPQADQALMSGIMALVNSAMLYLNATVPATEGSPTYAQPTSMLIISTAGQVTSRPTPLVNVDAIGNYAIDPR